MTDAMTKKPHRGTLILILGILGLVCCMPCGIVAWVLGKSDLQAMDRGELDPEGRSLTNAGKICGIISVALFVVGIVVWGALLALGVVTSASMSGH